MREEGQLAERLARLRGNTTASASSLQGRLNALSGGRVPVEGAEEDFNSRLASLVSEGEGKPSSPDDINARLAGLSTSNGGVATATDVQPYGVPEVRGWFDSAGSRIHNESTSTPATNYALF